jgi:hypothetical protein
VQLARPRPVGQHEKPKPRPKGALNVALRILSRVGMVVLPVALLGAIAFGVLYVRLQYGPISLRFLAPPIEHGISSELDGLAVRIDDATVELSKAGGLEFRLRNIAVSEKDKDLVISAPLASVSMSIPGLLAGRIVPSRVDLIEPRMYVIRTESGEFVLSFANTTTDKADAPSPSQEAEPKPLVPPAAAIVGGGGPELGSFRKLDLARLVTESTARARRGENATSYLEEFGLKDAVLVLQHSGRSNEWRIPSLTLDLKHKRRRSIISGSAMIWSEQGPWSVDFRTEDSERSQSIRLEMSIRDLVPSSMAGALPELAVMTTLDMPVAGNIVINLSSEGEVKNAKVALNAERGLIRIPALPKSPLEIDSIALRGSYDSAARRFELEPSTLNWRNSHVTFVGNAVPDTSENSSDWLYEIKATEGGLSAKEFGISNTPIDLWRATGRVVPEKRLVKLDALAFKAAGGELMLKGETQFGPHDISSRVEGQISPMSVTALKTAWPSVMAKGAREWVGENVSQAEITGGSLRYASGVYLEGMEPPPKGADHRFTLTLEAKDVEASPFRDLPTVRAPILTTHVENDAFEVLLPDATLGEDPGAKRPFLMKQVRFASEDVEALAPEAHLTFQMQSGLPPVLDLLQRMSIDTVSAVGLTADKVDGKAEGQFDLTVPLVPRLSPSDIKVAGSARISEGRAKKMLGQHDVQGANIFFDFSDKVIDAKGDMVVAGATAKLTWQKILDAPPDRQPPLRITSTLDTTDRKQLGMDVNNLLEGEVPVEITANIGTGGDPEVSLKADLTKADMMIEGIGWRKPPGRSATVQCDVVKIRDGVKERTELQNFRLVGENIAIEGMIGLGPDSSPREFHFPTFSLNVVSQLDLQGTLGTDGVWDIKAKGPTYDGSDFFRSLFSYGQMTEQKPQSAKTSAGIDLDVDIGNVIGLSGVGLRGVKMKASKRAAKLTFLDGRGTLDGGKPLTVSVKPGERLLVAESPDAGQAFKLIGFYPNMQGGRIRLEVNLDGRGPAEKTGTVFVDNFKVLGDPVVSDIVGSADSSQPAIGIGGKRHVVREVFQFDKMRVPFSVGHGQFVLEDSYVRGPLQGATIRGKVDYNTRSINLGGTYIPLQGLNNAFGGIPVLGELLSGPRGEGIFGITFAIQGAMANPQVIVNPLSMVAPGIFREMFQMSNPNTKVQPRGDAPATRSTAKRTRSNGKSADVVDGWSSETTKGKSKR